MPRLAAMFHRELASLFSAPLQGRREKGGEALSLVPDAEPKAHGWYWTQHPMVRDRINMLLSGNRHLDAYGRLADFLDDNGLARPLGQCASLGCGAGGLERDLARRGLIGAIDGYDPSGDAVAEARRLAAEQGFSSIRYHETELGAEILPEARFDAIFTHSSLHRVEALERERLNAAFGVSLRRALAYSSVCIILHGLDAAEMERVFRAHAASLAGPVGHDASLPAAVAIDGKTLRGSFDAFHDRKAAHVLIAFATDGQVILGHVAVAESNEIPAAQELIATLGLQGRLFTLDAMHCQKNLRDRPQHRQPPAGATESQPSHAV